MAKIFIDDTEYTVPDGLTVLQAAQHVGIEIPHYCYHPGLPIDGNCRMCLVEIEKMPKPMISCHTRIVEGMSIKTKTEKITAIRKSVMEFLLLNHPLDCPECDQAGECRLQEYYMKYDMQTSHLGEIAKTRKAKVVPLGPNVMLDAERCILCTRCIRFCNEITHTRELYIKNRGSHSEITTFPGQQLDNAYATCTVDVCPVGALTSKDFRFKKRVWFLKTTESICNGCANGCNIFIDHDDGTVYRYRPRYNAEVNQYWMCDEGRLSYKREQENRIHSPFLRTLSGQAEALSLDDANAQLAALLNSHASESIAFIVSAQQSNETLRAIADFRSAFFPTSPFYYSRLEVENPSADNFLIKADKNPNLSGVQALTHCRPISEWQGGPSVVIAFEHLGEADIARIFNTQGKPPTLVALVSRENTLSQKANLICPIPNYWEESGSFTNAAGKTQSFDACFEPTGDTRSISTYLNEWRVRLKSGVKK